MRTVIDACKSGLSSSRFWKVALLWLLCLLYVLFQGGKTSLMLFTMVSVLAIYWLVGGLGGIRRIKGTRTLTQDKDHGGWLKAGEQIKVRLEVQLPKFMPLPYIIVKEQLKRHNGESWAFEDSVVPRFGKASHIAYQTPPLERGRYMFAGTECYSEDIFGLMKHKGVFETGGEFRVLPRTVFIPHWQLQSRNSRLAGPETAIAMSRRETTQINGVRDYMYGDRISRIHWNATAKTGSWKSKEFEHESLPKTILVLDAHTISYLQPSQFELAVSTAASLLEYGARERISMGLCTLGKTFCGFAPAEGYLERQRMLHHLVDVHADGYGSYMNKLESGREYFTPGAFFILISPLRDDKLLEIMRWGKSHRMAPYHIRIGASGEKEGRGDGWIAALKERGMKGIAVSSLQDLPVKLGGGKS
ncbi:DUF58 domain-containing protein [Paenibacillus sp. M1]|uniref:DUF58 domain-containing protein n=1 Tax=Paenibacillus haidiansis TaxID=1574488 RepID=A0ABU7VM77_9BACL